MSQFIYIRVRAEGTELGHRARPRVKGNDTVHVGNVRQSNVHHKVSMIGLVWKRRNEIWGSRIVTDSIQKLKQSKSILTCIHITVLTQYRAGIVCWVSESLCLFERVNNHGFKNIMKTGRPEYYIPSPSTLSWDVRLVFTNIWQRMAKMLQVSIQTIKITSNEEKLTVILLGV